MSHFRRKIRQVKELIQSHPDNQPANMSLDQIQGQLNQIELEHYRQCMENYPTNLEAKYNYAVRLVRNRRYDEAIPLFQEAQKDPKKRLHRSIRPAIASL